MEVPVRTETRGGRDPEPVRPDAAVHMALDGLARAFEEAGRGRDWFAMKAELRRVEDAVQAVWYAAKVRDDGNR